MKQTISAKNAFLASILKPGEMYAGILLGKDGEPDHHLILIAGQANDVTFQQAQEFAKKSSGVLPTRREQSLLFANLKEQFDERWYWSGEKHSDTRFAWYQHFDRGFQYGTNTFSQVRARAVRRIVIE
ncbi:MAG TPA: hypothetical protein DCK83_00515 [Gallionellaceae bacterium]|nr:hypothetical protein [Gallionellaceae bacterium]